MIVESPKEVKKSIKTKEDPPKKTEAQVANKSEVE
jgi:hypothetical protein